MLLKMNTISPSMLGNRRKSSAPRSSKPRSENCWRETASPPNLLSNSEDAAERPGICLGTRSYESSKEGQRRDLRGCWSQSWGLHASATEELLSYSCNRAEP